MRALCVVIAMVLCGLAGIFIFCEFTKFNPLGLVAIGLAFGFASQIQVSKT